MFLEQYKLREISFILSHQLRALILSVPSQGLRYNILRNYS